MGGISLQGHILNQRQLDAITPVLNDHMHGYITKKGFEPMCIQALEKAGCPLGYDTTLPGADTSIEVRAAKWRKDGRVGSSSRAIHDHMLGVPASRNSWPSDPDDLNRCLLLLELIPEWKPRMPEMAKYGKEWKGLAENWAKITELFLEEVGLDWSKGGSAHATYDLMKDCMR